MKYAPRQDPIDAVQITNLGRYGEPKFSAAAEWADDVYIPIDNPSSDDCRMMRDKFLIEVGNGARIVRVGDWVCMHRTGEIFVMPNASFKAVYQMNGEAE